MSKCPNVKSHIGVPNQGPKSGSQIRVPYQPPNWGPKSGLKIGVPNRGPKSGTQNGVPKRGPKSGSQIGVPNPKIIRVAVASLTVKSLIVGLFLSSSYTHMYSRGDRQFDAVRSCGLFQNLATRGRNA
jgi:hypothetical protein